MRDYYITQSHDTHLQITAQSTDSTKPLNWHKLGRLKRQKCPNVHSNEGNAPFPFTINVQLTHNVKHT